MKNRQRQMAVLGCMLALAMTVPAVGATKNTAQVTEAETEAAAKTEAAGETEKETTEETEAALEDGVYEAEFNTDSGMFHVNEAMDGKGTLTVKDGEMMIHISMPSENIVNLFPGLAEDAKKEGADLLDPTTDTVTYSDGMTEEVYGFDVPVPVLEKEFDLALIGTKGVWYDHKVSVSNPVLAETEALTEKQ